MQAVQRGHTARRAVAREMSNNKLKQFLNADEESDDENVTPRRRMWFWSCWHKKRRKIVTKPVARAVDPRSAASNLGESRSEAAAPPVSSVAPAIGEADFDRVMSSEAGCAAMLAFAKSEMSDENVLFFIEIQKYGKCEDDASRKEVGESIVATFLSKNAPTPANLPARITHAFTGNPVLGENEGTYECTPDVFAPAEAEIRTLLRKDTFSRFQSSPAAAQLVKDEPELAATPRVTPRAVQPEAAPAQ